MAILPLSSSPVKEVSSKRTRQSLKRSHGVDNEREPKRAKCPGIRVKGNRIYDTLNGNSCHQCRQKTLDFVASCRNQKDRKLCTIKFCHKCLLNRYGEKAQEVDLLSDWNCPKCRGICNCSFCMKKKGCKPTGQLAVTAKASGFSSVYAMLKGKDSEGNYVNQISGSDVQDTDESAAISSMIPLATEKEQLVSSLASHEKENFLHGRGDLSSKSLKEKVLTTEKLKKVKRVGLKELRNGDKADKPFVTSSAKKSKFREKETEDTEKNEHDGTVVQKNRKLTLSTKSDVKSAEKFGLSRTAKNVSISHTKELGVNCVRERRKGKSPGSEKFLAQEEKVHEELIGVSSKEIINDAAVSHKRTVPANKELGVNHVGKQKENSLGCKSGPKQKAKVPEETSCDLEVHHMGKQRKKYSLRAKSDQMQKEKVPEEPNVELGINEVRLTRKESASGVKSIPAMKERVSKCILGSKESFLYTMTKDENGDMDGENCKDGTMLTNMQNHDAHVKSMTIQEPEIPAGSVMEKISIDIPLPPGSPLTKISGFELKPEDIGNVLQLLEFCAVFGKAVNVRKGEAEAVLRELIRERPGRLSRNSFALSVDQFHVKLISAILKDKGKMSHSFNNNNGRDAWLKALSDLISGSDFGLRQLQLDSLNKGIDYHKLDFSKKLRLLNFLCDETLATKKLRSWIDNQNMKFVEQEKKERSEAQAVRYEEKRLKQKMLDEVATAMISKNAPLSIEEHDAVVSKIKMEVARAHSRLLELKRKLSYRSQSSEASRIEPVFSDAHGRKFWKLQSYADENAILLQDMKESVERWSLYGVEHKNNIQLYFSSRMKI